MIVSQSAFVTAVLDPQHPALAGLTDGAGRTTAKRFDVYRNNVAAGLTDALEQAFPVIHKLVGTPFFRAMAGVYLRKHLPRSPLMMDYGDQMPRFLRRFPPAQSLPYLPDMARLEIAMRASYHAADVAPLSAEALGALAPDRLMGATMTLAPALAVLQSSFPIADIYRANTGTDAPPPVMTPQNVLITRPLFDPVQHQISDAAATFVLALQDGDPLGLALTKAGPKLDLGAALGLLLRQNALISLT